MIQQFLFQPLCLSCGLPLAASTSFCMACARFFLSEPPAYQHLFPHEGPGRGFLHALRGGAPYTAAAWALNLLEKRGRIDNWKGQGVQLVLPAPQRMRARNSASGLVLLARGVAGALSCEFIAPAFRKKRDRTQHGRNLTERMDTACFVELAIPPARVRGKRVLVLDDVETTGTTLDLCAYVLRKAGAARVETFALAKQESAALAKQEQA